ncbi:hypothetical protein [Porphyrobacter sp. YT40]|uniref:hypothetical protein n=1 Tax=Porphyrobacter sp. YT40 TaxID=2547601 RepID=UPI00257440CE|nr:hypothetical protein [Porphyrobacter sp. YT40]
MALEAIAPRGFENPIAIQHASAHAVLGLLAILLPLVLRHARQQVFDEDTV